MSRSVSGFVKPCQPVRVSEFPAGSDWIHEIKHDGYRLQVWRDGARVCLFTRTGVDWTERYPAVVEAAGRIRAKSFLLDGEVCCTEESGRACFELLRAASRQPEAEVRAFDVLMLNGEDIRSRPIERRKLVLEKLLAGSQEGILLVEHLAADAETVFQAACAMGLEGIVSKKLGSRYVSGQSRLWRKLKNPESAAVQRERLEDWSRPRRRAC